MAGFLVVPLKKTNEVNLNGPLDTYIASAYSSSDHKTEGINEATNELNKLRNKAVCQPLDRHESSLEMLYRYYDQLSAIENKLPLSPNQIPVAFKWKDAFDKGSLFFGKASLTLSYGSFERACVLFNIGSLQSQIAATQQLSTDEEMKAAAKLFQASAGIFTHLKESVLSMVQQDPTPDLVPDTLSVLAAIMLAQGQEAIYLKAAKDKMKPILLVKIAAQCADFYQEAYRQMTRELLKGLWDKEWVPTVNGKYFAFLSLAQYHQAVQNNAEKEIGAELARLQESLRLMGQAQNYFAQAGSQSFKAETVIIQKAHDIAKKDNDFIYHERIPDIKTLPALPKAALAKPLPVNSPMSPRFKDLFESLVPVAVHQAIAAYEVRKAEVVNMEMGRIREHTQLMNGILTSLNLPAALDDATNQQALPETIREKSSRVKSAGGLQELDKKIGELPMLLKRNREVLDETSRILSEEKSSDDQLRGQFKEKWTRMPSEKLTEPLWQEIGKFKHILETATNADGIVKQKFDANRQGMELLSKPEPELKSAIPGLGQNSGATQSSQTVTKLRQIMGDVEKLKTDRDRMEKELKDVSFDMTSEFLKAMGEAGSLNEADMSSQKLNEIYGPIRTEISESVKRQEDVLKEVQETNMRFCQEKSGNQTGAERENTLKLLAQAHDSFMELKSNLEEGSKFYNDLTPLLVRLQQKVSDFCFARKTEKEDLMKDMQQNIVNQPTTPQPTTNPFESQQPATTTTTSAPPRPPPPTFNNAPIQQQQTYPPQGQPYGAPYGAPPAYPTAGAYPAGPPQQQQQQQPFVQPPGATAPYPGYAQQQQPYPAYGTQPSQTTPYPSTTPYPMSYGTYPGAGQAAPNAPTGYNPYGTMPPQGYPYPYPPPQQQQQWPHP